MNEMKKRGLNCCSIREDDSFNEKEAELRISSIFATVAILTAGCLETKEMLFALQAAAWCYHPRTSRVILVSM